MPEWDSIQIWKLGSAASALYASTAGCGCCADGKRVDTPEEAIALVESYILERQAEINEWYRWLDRMQDSKEILPL